MNLSNARQRVLSGKWAIRKENLFALYEDINQLTDVRMGGIFGKVFGDPVLAQIEKVSTTEAVNNSEDLGDIAILTINGTLVKGANQMEQLLLGYVNTDDISKQLDDLLADASVKCIILNFISWGGEVTGIPELARKIKQVDSIKPVYGWCEQHMCSAAMWLASQCRFIGATPSSTVGSIGVWQMFMDVSEAMEKAGIKTKYISSGKYKLIGSDSKPMTPEEEDILTKEIVKIHDSFKNAVLGTRSKVEPDTMEGLCYTGEDALDKNLVDVCVDDFTEFLEIITNQ